MTFQSTAAPAAQSTDWGPVLALVAFVVISALLMGWIGWKKKDS